MIDEVSTREAQLKQARDELSRSERHFRSLIENASDITTVLGRDGTILYTSPSVTRLLGYTPEELHGRSGFEHIHPDDHRAVADRIERHGRGMGVGSPLRYRQRHRDGSWRTLEAIGTNLFEDPDVAGIVVNSRDITERELAESEVRLLNVQLSELNADLDRRVKLKTAELQDKMEELAAAKDATDAAMKAQETLLSNVAHDLRTPLTIVMGFSEDLLRKAKKKGQDAFIPDLRLIVNKGKDLLELINDLLNLSKAMNDKGVEIDLATFDVAQMIQGRMEGIGTVAQKYGNTIEFRPAEDLGAMTADAAKVWRVLMNLLTNACKFTKDGTITLEAAREPADDGTWIVFRVRDTGMGMGPEQRARCSTGSSRSTSPAPRCRPAWDWDSRSACSTAGRWGARSASRAKWARGRPSPSGSPPRFVWPRRLPPRRPARRSPTSGESRPTSGGPRPARPT